MYMLQPGCTAYEPRPLWFRIFCMAVILSGKQQNGDTTRPYSVSCSSKTPDANMRSPYGDTLHVCLVTCALRNHNNGVKHLADNCSWSWARQMYIVVSLKSKFKRHMPGEFHDCSWVFWSWHCSRKGARRVESKKENEDDESRFSPFPGSSL